MVTNFEKKWSYMVWRSNDLGGTLLPPSVPHPLYAVNFSVSLVDFDYHHKVCQVDYVHLEADQ